MAVLRSYNLIKHKPIEVLLEDWHAVEGGVSSFTPVLTFMCVSCWR